MAGAHMEIPGYYYDSEKNRYFRKGPNYSSPKKTDEAVNTQATGPNRLYNLVHHLRKRTTQLDPCSDLTIRITEELMIPFYCEWQVHSVELTRALKQLATPVNPQHITIKDIKINETGQYLFVAVHYEDKYEIRPTCGRRDYLLLLNTLPDGNLEIKPSGYTSATYASLSSGKCCFSDYFCAKELLQQYSNDVNTSNDITGIYRFFSLPNYRTFYGLSCINTKEEVFQFSIGVKVASTTCCDRRGNIIIGTARGECVFDKSEEKVKIGNTEVSAIATMNKSSLVCAGLKNSKLVVIDRSTKQKYHIQKYSDRKSNTRSLSTHITDLRPLYDDDKIVVASKDRLELWDVVSCNRIHQFKIPSSSPSDCMLMDNDRIAVDYKDLYLMVSNYHRGCAYIWSITTGNLLHVLKCNDVNIDHEPGLEKDHHPTSVCHTHSFGGYHGYPAMIVSRGFDLIVYRPIIS